MKKTDNKKTKKAPTGENYLDYVPCHNPEIKYEIDGEHKVTIFQENKGMFNFIAQKLFKKPRISQIHLDEMGNFIWPLMDGERNLIEIAELVKAEFGEKAEPMYNRLVKYVRTLETYGFIAVKPKH